MKKAAWLLLLHCHLPFVRHPEHETFLEENWLFEAVTEAYLPLLESFNRLMEKGVGFRITVSISPPLCEMLADELLQQRCARYIAERAELCGKELKRLGGTDFERCVKLYLERYRRQLRTYGENAGEAVLEGFKRLKEAGAVELITSAATHALLPLCHNRASAFAQIEQGCRCYERYFGERPQGMWLPECAYSPDIVPLLLRSGIRYTFLETHGALLADPTPANGVFAPLSTTEGLVLFARDPQSSKQVWSGDEGYPGDPSYREFFRDAGYDAPYEHIAPYLSAGAGRHPLGLKYHRISGETPEKLPYEPAAAEKRAGEHARHFVVQRNKQVEELSDYTGTTPVIVSPYDAELFGHWWYEGPRFLERVLEEMDAPDNCVRTATAADRLAETEKIQVCNPSPSTWGYQGYYDIWVSGSNDWIYRHLAAAEEKMVQIAGRGCGNNDLRRRALRQCIRELMLAQSSDWPFLIGTGAAADYARRRLKTHLSNFRKLAAGIETGAVECGELEEMEQRHNIFSGLDRDIYAACPDLQVW